MRNIAPPLVLTALVTSCLATAARADLIAGLYRTGTDNFGAALPVGSVDPHYTLNNGVAYVQSPQFTGDFGTTWITSPTTPWIGPTPDHRNESDLIPYNYTTTFSLPSNVDLDSVSLSFTVASDNGVMVYVNGHDTGLPALQSQFLAFTTFGVDGMDSPFFTTGVNTLTFSVENGPGLGPSPTGLLIDDISGSYSLVPEPSTGVLAIAGIVLALVSEQRKRVGSR